MKASVKTSHAWMHPRRGVRALGSLFLGIAMLPSCASIGAHKIHQIYYLGIFDPTEQLPPSFYRIRVRGSADWFSTVNYAAGWVPAKFVDSLNTSIGFDPETKELEFKTTEDEKTVQLKTGRRLVLFGPEGSREAPKDQRLAVVMSSNPSAFFKAIDDALGQLSAAKQIEKTSGQAVNFAVLERVLDATREKSAVEKLQQSVTVASPPPAGGGR